MASHAGAARFAYNAGLAHVKGALENSEPADWSHYALRRWWNANKDALAVNKTTGEVWWDQNSKEAYSGGLRSLSQGLSNWSKSRKGQRKGKRVGFPRFKSKNTTMRFEYSTGFTAPTVGDPYGLKLPRIGRVHCMENAYLRVAGARLIRITVSRRAGNWYASLTVERERPSSPAHTPKRGAVGVDLGVKNLATLSDGTVIPNPRALGARLKALRKAQQALSRKVKGSARREKARERVARLHARVADVRADAIHKATTMIASNYSVAGHVNAPRDVLVKLAHDDEERVCEVALCDDNMPERVFDEVIVRDASKAATIHKLVHYSQSVHAQVLAYTRFNSPYANDDECLALRGVSWDAGEWLRKHDMKGVR